MKNAKPLLLLILSCLLWDGCRKDYLYIPPQGVVAAPVSFQADIVPIFNTSCNMVPCHSSGGQAPDVSAANAYDQLLGLGYVDTLNAEGSKLYLRMNSSASPMPPGGKLSADKINMILAWIKQGAQNN